MTTLRLPQPFEELEHTADVGVRVLGAGPEETLARLVCAFGRMLAGTDDLDPGRTLRVTAQGGELSLAAVDVLRELLYRFATEGALPASARVIRIDPSVEVEVGLADYDPERHREGLDIKAVTLHRARFEAEGAGWMAEIVFDI